MPTNNQHIILPKDERIYLDGALRYSFGKSFDRPGPAWHTDFLSSGSLTNELLSMEICAFPWRLGLKMTSIGFVNIVKMKLSLIGIFKLTSGR